ncbi:unnamed protein product [Camellia sinensis]
MKLKELKMVSKTWNIEVFGNINHQLKQAGDELHALDLVAGTRPLQPQECTKRREFRGLVWKLRQKNERLWLQKSRLNWEKNRDENTFFHVIARKRQCRSMLDLMVVDGGRQEDPGKVRMMVLRHFTKLLQEEWPSRPKPSGPFHKISNGKVVEIVEAEFSKVEVWAVVKDCERNKALGPDGFNLA